MQAHPPHRLGDGLALQRMVDAVEMKRREARDAGEMIEIDVAIEVSGQVGVDALDATGVILDRPRRGSHPAAARHAPTLPPSA